MYRWMGKQNVVYIYTIKYNSVLKRKGILQWMNAKESILNEINKSQKKINTEYTNALAYDVQNNLQQS